MAVAVVRRSTKRTESGTADGLFEARGGIRVARAGREGERCADAHTDTGERVGEPLALVEPRADDVDARGHDGHARLDRQQPDARLERLQRTANGQLALGEDEDVPAALQQPAGLLEALAHTTAFLGEGERVPEQGREE